MEMLGMEGYAEGRAQNFLFVMGEARQRRECSFELVGQR
jgi:hypothetical protein